MRPNVGPNLGVGSWIERRARIAPDRVALVGGGRSVSYAALAARVRRLANGLRRHGVERGDRVAWLGPNDPAFLESLFAVGLLGAVMAPVNHRLPAEERAYVLADTAPTLLIEHGPAEPTPTPGSVRHRVSVGGSPVRGSHPNAADAVDYEELIAEAPDARIDEAIGLDELFLLPHTSGTTGHPKAVMLSHGNVTWNVVNFLSCADFRSDDVTIAIAPFFRVGGTGVNVLPVLFMGGTVVVPDDASPEGILDSMERHRVTVGFGNPDLLDALARSDRWSAADLSSIRFILTGGAPVPERLIRTFLDRGITLLQGYGLSEGGPLALLLDAPNALDRRSARPGGRRCSSMPGSPPPTAATQARARPASCWCGAPTSWSATGTVPPRPRRCSSTGDGCGPATPPRVDDEGFVWIVDRVAARFRVCRSNRLSR